MALIRFKPIVSSRRRALRNLHSNILFDVVTAASASGEPPEFVMNALTPEERSDLIVARKKILADRIEAAKKNAEAERIEAEAKQKEAEVKQKEVEAKEVAIVRRAILDKEADERRAKLEKEADERKAAQDKAMIRDEKRVRSQTTRETLARSKAAELASIEECRRLCPDFDTRKRPLPSADGDLPVTRAKTFFSAEDSAQGSCEERADQVSNSRRACR